MNFYYTLNDAELRPRLLGNFNSFHHAESELRKLINGNPEESDNGYLFLHKSALPWQDQDVPYLGPFRLVRILSTRKSKRIGTVNLFHADPLQLTVPGSDYLNSLPKAS